MVRPKNQKVWSHYRETENKSVTCKYCERKYKIANLQKMLRHLLKCTICPENFKAELKANSRPVTSLQSPKNATLLPRATIGTTIDKENVDPGSNLNMTIESTASLPATKVQDLHSMLAKAIYVSGTPLSIVEHPLWIQFIEKLQPIYKLPTRKTLSTNMLDKTYKEMERDLKNELLSQKCLHLLLDGWSNCRNEGIINVLISKPEPFFVKSIATGDNRHTGEYISKEILNVMSEYGANKFVILIGDNASNMQRAFRLVKDAHPHIMYLNCTAHTLHLLCKEIIKIDVINSFRDIATNVVKTVKKSQILTSLLSQIVKEKGTGESLKLPCETRWGSYCTSFKSVENTKVGLQTLAVHERATLLPDEEKSALLDNSFWLMIRQCILLLEPISDTIFQLESNKQNIHKVYLVLKNMKSKLEFCLPEITIIRNDTKNHILSSVDNRIRMCLKPIHLAAYLLDPRFQGAELNENEQLDAMEFIHEMGQNADLNVMPNLASYKAKEGFWSRRFVWANITEIDATTWWKGICGSTALSKIAVQILTAPCTSAAVERSFSCHSNIHSSKRNRLTTERAAKLTFISYNWNLLNKQMNDGDDDISYCMLNSSPTSPRQTETPTPHYSSDSPQPSTSGIKSVEFLDISRISEDSSDTDSN